MSDIDSDSERNNKSNKLGLEEIETNNNIFRYGRESGRQSSSAHSASDDDHNIIGGHEDEELVGSRGSGKKGGNKLSDMLGMDQIKDVDNPISMKREIEQSPQESNGESNKETIESIKQETHVITKVDQTGQSNKKEQQLPEQPEKVDETKKQDPAVTQPKIPEIKPENQLNPKTSQFKSQSQVEQTKKQEQKQPHAIQDFKQETHQVSMFKVEDHVKQSPQKEAPTKILQIKQKPFPFVVKQQAQKTVIEPSKQQSQLKYNQELQDDLEVLKKYAKKKKAGIFSEKQSEKHKLNKTMLPAATISHKQLQFEQTAETKAFELKMITAMAQEKKKQNYNRLRQWDKRRAESLAIHRNMIEILQTQIDKRIKSSIENLQIYTTFLREKAKQQQKYVAHHVINTKYALQNNSISKNVYINCTATLNSLSDENNNKCRKINDFIHLIRNDILRDSIQVHLMQSQRELLRVREKISTLKAALRKHNSETEEKTGEFSLFFNENSMNMSIDSDRDFYSTQIQFLQKACQQTLTQKKLGQNCLEYLHTAIKQQIKRSKVIKQAMITFAKGLEQCYSIQTDPAQIQQLSKAEENKLIQQFYSLEEIFDERCLTVFKTFKHMPNDRILTTQIFTDFINKFEFQGFDSRMILLKQFNVRYHPTSKTEVHIEQACYIVITVDKWIHLYFNKQKTEPYIKPDVSIRATMKNLEIKSGKSLILDLVIKDEKRSSMISYFWESKNDRIYRIQFQKKDSRQEFLDYIAKIKG